MINYRGFAAALSGLILTASCSDTSPPTAIDTASCLVEFIILGTSQDAGTPQIGNTGDSAWSNLDGRRLAASAALIDYRSGARYLFEASPDIRQQLMLLDKMAPSKNGSSLGLSNIFITHAHIGHYAGLIFLGRESAGTREVDVTVMPRMASYLKNNGPWDQLVSLNNININSRLADKVPFQLADSLSVTPYLVPHRDEYSETVGFVIGPK